MESAQTAARKAAEWIERRNQAMRADRAKGHSIRQIAEATGLSVGTVHSITKQEPTNGRS